MTEGPSLAQLLETEHRQIDAGIEAYTKTEAGAGLDALQDAIDGLRRHIYLEEAFCFDALRARGLMMPVMVMLREHGELWRSCDRIEKSLDDADDEATTAEAEKLLGLLDSHNGKEEPVLYPHISEAIGPDANADLLKFLDTGTMPEGWICATAAA